MQLNEYLVKSIDKIPNQTGKVDIEDLVAFTALYKSWRGTSLRVVVRGDYYTKIAKIIAEETPYGDSSYRFYQKLKHDINAAHKSLVGGRKEKFVDILIHPDGYDEPLIYVHNFRDMQQRHLDDTGAEGVTVHDYSKESFNINRIKTFLNT